MFRLIILLCSFSIFILSFDNYKGRIAELEQRLKIENSEDRIAEISFELSVLYQHLDSPNNIKKAIQYIDNCIEISNNKRYIAKYIKALHQKGKLYADNKEYEDALKNHKKALNLAIENSNQKAIANAYINIGDTYVKNNKEKLAKENFLEAIKIGDKIKNPLIKAIANSRLGDLKKQLNKKNIAIQYYLEALDNALQTENIYMQGIIYKKIGVLQKGINQIEKSAESFKKSLKKFEKINNNKELSEINFFLGEYHQDKKDYDNAIIYMKNSLGFAELSGHQIYIKKGYENLADVYEKNNDYKNAYSYQKYYCAIKDTRLISELEAQLEIEKKNGEIALINQQRRIEFETERTRSYILLFIAIIVIIFSIILYNNLRQKNKINEELKLATKLATKSKKEKEEFFAFTSHEIRTPLNAVVGMTQLLEKTNLTEKQTKYLKTIKYSSNNILFLVNDVLDLTKLEKGLVQLENVNTSIREIIEEIIDSISFKTLEKDVVLSYDIDNKIPQFVKSDPLRLNQILLNLIDNALKFTKKGSVNVVVSFIKEIDNKVLINFLIKDTGIGISEEKIGKIFNSYQQANIDTARNYGGTGLGLAITKQLVELMGGEIKIKSKENQGTSFSFDIYFYKSALQKETKKTQQNNLSNLNILVVDDTELNRSIFYDLLYSKENNINVFLAENGEKAIEKCKENIFDIIIMDLQMPVLNGFETTKKIRNYTENTNKNTPIIAITAHTIDGVSDRCEEAGMNDYISKPININQLLGKIKQHIIPKENIKITNNDKKTEVINLKTKYIDLTNLSELVKNNNLKILKYINLFINNIDEDLNSIKQSITNKEWEKCAKTAHKIKGNASYMGMFKAKEILIRIEKLSTEVGNSDKNIDIVGELEVVLNKSIKDLKHIKQNITEVI